MLFRLGSWVLRPLVRQISTTPCRLAKEVTSKSGAPVMMGCDGQAEAGSSSEAKEEAAVPFRKGADAALTKFGYKK